MTLFVFWRNALKCSPKDAIESSERQLCLKIVRRIRLVLKALRLSADDTGTTSQPEVCLKWSDARGFEASCSAFKKIDWTIMLSGSMTRDVFSELRFWFYRELFMLAVIFTPPDSDEKLESSKFTSSPHMSIVMLVHFNWNKQATTGIL